MWYGMNRLKTSLGKITLSNPITVASGTFNLDYKDYFDINALGAIVTKTITSKPKAGNKPPRLVETPSGLLNSIGLQNNGIDYFVENELQEFKEYKPPLIVSFSGSSIGEFIEVIRKLELYPISGYEINISCPNVENEGIAFGVDAEIVYKLTKELKGLTKRELIVKLSPNVTDIVEIALAAEAAGASSLALINTLIGMSIDWKSGKPHLANTYGGLSGPAIKPVALYMVHKVAKAVNIPILAMGGICNWKDALEFFFAGASVVAIGTYLFVEPKAPVKICGGIRKYLEEQDLCLRDIVGKAIRKGEKE